MGPSDSRDGSPSAQKRALKRPNHRAFAICGGMLLGLLCVAALQHWHGAGDDLGTPRDTLARRVRGGKVRGKSARRRLQKPSLRLGPAAVNDTAGVLFRFALLSDTHYWQPTAARAKWAQTADARAARDGLLVADSPTTSEAALRQLGAFAAGGGAFAVHLGDTMCGGSNFGQPRDECAPRAIRRAIPDCSVQFSDRLFTTSPGTWRRCGTCSQRNARHSAHGPSTTCLATTTSTLRSAGSPRGAR